MSLLHAYTMVGLVALFLVFTLIRQIGNEFMTDLVDLFWHAAKLAVFCAGIMYGWPLVVAWALFNANKRRQKAPVEAS